MRLIHASVNALPVFLGLILITVASSAGAQPSAAASAPGMPGFSRDLPRIPHEQQPEVRPYPDYVTEALKLTRLKGDERFRTPHGLTSQPERGYLVLPVQIEAFGFAPGFRAVVAARLDHELAKRQINSNRQTDVVDVDGPYARRFETAVLRDFAAQHPSSKIVALYVGHDGIDQAFMTLVLTDGQRLLQAHRNMALPAGAREAAAAMGAALPGMLDELKLGVPTPAIPASRLSACKPETWRLAPPRVGDGTALACHAIVVGTLLPDFDVESNFFPASHTPAKLAWLATAYVEANSAAPTQTARAIQDSAWSQLGLDKKMPSPVDSASAPESEPTQTLGQDDPVLNRLAQLLSARQRSRTSPKRSMAAVAEQFVNDAAQGLPPFIQAVFVERGNFDEAFRPVGLCEIERELPGMMPSAPCRDGQTRAPRASRAAYPSETALYREWRLAAFQKNLRYLGINLGDSGRLEKFLRTLPDDIATHPFIRQQRFKIGLLDDKAGNFDTYLDLMRNKASSFMQATADLLRYDRALAGYSISEHLLSSNTNVLRDPQIAQLIDDESRLLAVLRYDRFSSPLTPQPRRKGEPAAFLRTRLSTSTAEQAVNAPPPIFVSPPVMAAAPPVSAHRLFGWPITRQTFTEDQLRAQIAAKPNDMETRVQLAIQMLKVGKPLAEARRVIDEYPISMRIDARLAQSNDWAQPVYAFFFASEMDSARIYLQRVRDIGTGSNADMHARVRLRQLDGDVQGALSASSDRLRRYDTDFARRDLAGFLFMTGQKEAAWQVVSSRLAVTNNAQLWVGALVGHRIDQTSLADAKAWAQSRGLERSQVSSGDAVASYLHLHAVVDRLPGDSDIALLKELGLKSNGNIRWSASAQLLRMALQGHLDPADFESVRQRMAQTDSQGNRFMMPLFTWVAWQATQGRDVELKDVRETDLAMGDFDALLSKSLLLALEGHTKESLQFLNSARYQMSELGLGSNNVDRPTPAPYEYALASYLMFKRTGHPAYQAEALRFAKAHQQIFPFWGWSYAMEALLETNEVNRTIARCRARYLDPSSYFLSLVPASTDKNELACSKALWGPA